MDNEWAQRYTVIRVILMISVMQILGFKMNEKHPLALSYPIPSAYWHFDIRCFNVRWAWDLG
jgi:hypothetical protein